jgi:hypothetical protein
LQRLGLELSQPKVGCCGQAGSFGYEPRHYEVSMRVAEQALLPAVRQTPSDAIIIADGFSCRDQIRHGTGRRAMHTAEVLARALDAEGGLPERRYLEPAARPEPRQAAIAAGVAAGLALLLWATRQVRA